MLMLQNINKTFVLQFHFVQDLGKEFSLVLLLKTFDGTLVHWLYDASDIFWERKKSCSSSDSSPIWVGPWAGLMSCSG